LTKKIDTITSIRIPTKPDKTPRGFAYVEVTNNIDFEVKSSSYIVFMISLLNIFIAKYNFCIFNRKVSR